MNTEQTKIVYVIGHKNPDTDSVCAAIGYAYFKNLTDKRFLFTPGRAGRLNEETQFVLTRFGVAAPQEVESLTPTVSDLEMRRPISIHARDSVQALALLIQENGIQVVPVVDDGERLAGIVGIKDIARHYMNSVGFTDLSELPLSLDMLVKTLTCHVISNSRKVESLSGRILIASMQKGTIMNRVREGDVVIIGDQHDIQLDLVHAGCSALIVTDGIPIGNDVVAAAEEKGTLLLSSPHDAFATFQLMTMSVPVEKIMYQSCPTVYLGTTISELRKRIVESDYHSAVVVDNDDRLAGFVTRTDLLTPVEKRAVLVDHNEISQAVEGIEEAEILEIIDHHRVGDISTVAPIYVYNDPVGSTCTLVAGTMFLYQVRVPADIAGLLLSGILSDTLLLTLSTTTERDRQTAEKLAEIAGVSLKEYGKELLQASINTVGKSASELIAADFKEFQVGGKNLGVSQMMVLDCEEVDLREEELLDELERIRSSRGYDLAALLVTNPLSSGHERVLVKGETWMVEKAFNVEVKEDTCVLPTVLSRKKDFIPAIGRALRMVSNN
jgi:manganese-dependent inorganic pyrophosphatase